MTTLIYSLLTDPSYYSLEIGYLSSQTGVSVEYLRSLNGVRLVPWDWVNVFTYNNVTYVGLESRRIAYERDKEAGTNWVEDAITPSGASSGWSDGQCFALAIKWGEYS
jgi:hypothetical protein